MSEHTLTPKFVSHEALPGWLAELAEKAAVYVPQKRGEAVVFLPYAEGAHIELGRRPTESAKHTVFPRDEELFSFHKAGDPEAPGSRKLTLKEPAEPGDTVVFGALSCDARGFFAFDPVYDGCGTKGMARDTYYLKRRSRTTLIVKACKTALNTCFCHWVGGDPASSQGADVLATELDGGLLLQPVTDKGAALLGSAKLNAAGEAQVKAADEAHTKVRGSMGEAPALDKAQAALLALFENQDFWLRQSAGCLSCGACTYLCPTCYCFNITDESNGVDGTRIRTWDNCMSPLFTLEASGHNPRNGKAARLKNRVGHKFSYYPKIHGGRFSCCGCGRCIKSCPSSIDIRKIVLNAVKEKADV